MDGLFTTNTSGSSAGGAGRLGSSHPEGDRGSVLLETALAIPFLLAIGVALLWGLSVGSTILALSGTAHEAARAVARGDSPASVAALAAAGAPRAQVEVAEGSDLVSVALSQQVSIPLPLLEGFRMTVHRSATAAREDLPAW